MIKKYIRIWWMLASNSSQIALVSRFGAVMFTLGKLLRFVFFIVFILLLLTKTKTLAGYSLWQVVFFFATFNFIDIISQFFLREVYRFRLYVVSGSLDFLLVKPISVLFRSLFGGADILDLPMIIIAFIFLGISGVNLGSISMEGILLYIFLVCNALLISVAFHIVVLSLGVLTTEVDNTIMLYRDITQMGRVPVDIYNEPLRSLLTIVLPVGIMMTYPAKGLLGLLLPEHIIIAFLVSSISFVGSIIFWKYSLSFYTSASS